MGYQNTVKLQNKINRKIGNKEYRRWSVNLPIEQIEQLKWSEGLELEVKITGNKLVLKPLS